MKLLIVCLGNICRSPMAEGALRARLRAAGLEAGVVVDSAGTGDWHVGQPPDHRAAATGLRHGVDLSTLRARQLAAGDYTAFDWLLCADRANLREVRARAPAGATARSALFLEWAGQGRGAEVPDPYTGGQPHFEQVWSLVDGAARAIVDRLGAAAGHGRDV